MAQPEPTRQHRSRRDADRGGESGGESSAREQRSDHDGFSQPQSGSLEQPECLPLPQWSRKPWIRRWSHRELWPERDWFPSEAVQPRSLFQYFAALISGLLRFFEQLVLQGDISCVSASVVPG